MTLTRTQEKGLKLLQHARVTEGLVLTEHLDYVMRFLGITGRFELGFLVPDSDLEADPQLAMMIEELYHPLKVVAGTQAIFDNKALANSTHINPFYQDAVFFVLTAYFDGSYTLSNPETY